MEILERIWEILFWIIKYVIVPVLVLLIAAVTIAAVTHRKDWGARRAGQVTKCIGEIEKAIEFGVKYGDVPQSDNLVFRNRLGKASQHKWNAIRARDEGDLDKANSEIVFARIYIDQAREFCPQMRVPKEWLWEKTP